MLPSDPFSVDDLANGKYASSVSARAADPHSEFDLRSATATSPQWTTGRALVDDPQFGKVAFSAGVGAILIQLQAHRDTNRPPSGAYFQQGIAAYVVALSLLKPAPDTTATIESVGQWAQPLLMAA